MLFAFLLAGEFKIRLSALDGVVGHSSTRRRGAISTTFPPSQSC